MNGHISRRSELLATHHLRYLRPSRAAFAKQGRQPCDYLMFDAHYELDAHCRRCTGEPHPQHRIHAYLLRRLAVERQDQVWWADVTYSAPRPGWSCI